MVATRRTDTERLTALEARLEGAEARLAGLDARLDRLHAEMLMLQLAQASALLGAVLAALIVAVT